MVNAHNSSQQHHESLLEEETISQHANLKSWSNLRTGPWLLGIPAGRAEEQCFIKVQTYFTLNSALSNSLALIQLVSTVYTD